jgi:hypothetical protein
MVSPQDEEKETSDGPHAQHTNPAQQRIGPDFTEGSLTACTQPV